MATKSHIPYEIKKTNHIGPDNPQFHSFDLNVAILTKYGRYVFLRHGNEERCSSFFATLATIVNKLEMSFGSETQPASTLSITQDSRSLNKALFNFTCLKEVASCTFSGLKNHSLI